jgi:hypothetical protein
MAGSNRRSISTRTRREGRPCHVALAHERRRQYQSRLIPVIDLLCRVYAQANASLPVYPYRAYLAMAMEDNERELSRREFNLPVGRWCADAHRYLDLARQHADCQAPRRATSKATLRVETHASH